MRTKRSPGQAGWMLGVLLALTGCGGDTPPEGACTSNETCGAGTCIDGTCVDPPRDAGGDDAGSERDGSADDAGDDGGTGDDGSTPMDLDASMEFDAGPMMELDAGPTATTDSDGDFITDILEGRATGLDTDGDGTPDWQDTDSDADGISDLIEAGDEVLTTPALDSDFDGVPDFRDQDSDGNGVPDTLEGALDRDLDTRPDFRDLDNDNDGLDDVIEIGADPSAPVDTDGDGTPDYDTADSDGDTIADEVEGLFDTDADTLPDLRDLDTDGDTLSDAREAGDADLATPPVDTDLDGVADFRDPDSDGDGLADGREVTYGTSPVRADSDGDGVSDLIEVGAGTDPLRASDSPRTRGDFVFLEPYMLPADPARDTLQFSTNLQRADVYFLMDNTGSMGGTIAALQAGLTGTVIPSITTSIPEAWFGVGGFDDYPIGTYGSAGIGTDTAGISHDQAFFQYQIMTPTAAVAQTAVNRYRTNGGYDGPESGVAALYALASRNTLGGYARYATGTVSSATPPTCPAGYRGAACFRPDAVPIVIVMTDVDQHNSPTCGCNYLTTVPSGGPAYATTITSLATLNARVVGIATSTGANAFLNRLILDSTIARGAPGVSGDYIVSAPGGAGLSSAITTLVRRAAQVPLDVSASAVDIVDPGEAVDAVASFLDHLETRGTAAPGRTCTMGFTTIDRAGIDADAFPDTFQRVTPGAPVCFDIIPKMNTTVMPTLDPQIFRARINVVGDGFTPLDSRVIYFLVPPRVPDPNE